MAGETAVMPSHTEDWRTLPWRAIERNVFRLQQRIYRATARGKSTANRVHDKDSSSEEPCEVKVSCTVLEWRGDGRPSSRP